MQLDLDKLEDDEAPAKKKKKDKADKADKKEKKEKKSKKDKEAAKTARADVGRQKQNLETLVIEDEAEALTPQQVKSKHQSPPKK